MSLYVYLKDTSLVYYYKTYWLKACENLTDPQKLLRKILSHRSNSPDCELEKISVIVKVLPYTDQVPS